MNYTQSVELLAPAGDLSCLHAAVSAGADAVYLGLGEFNARRNAGNFDLGSLAEACDYAHLRGVRVYVTLNVEILPSELARAVELARGAWSAGADAFIVQDIGLATELRRALPDAALHVSTQMNTHSAAGIEAAARLGAQRVTLARELSIDEIAELAGIAAEFGMEVETFAHGALCVCYSGQCLMSSMIGGRSANRGLCAQACRLPYELHREGRFDALPAEGEHLLSPRDLCSVNLLPSLREAGVASLKIEGRMKSADYVYAVVSVYREVLDSGQPATEQQMARLSEAFSRGFTTAYLEGERGNEIMSYGRPNNRGVFAGRVSRVLDDAVEVVPEIELHGGDVVEFWTNRGHFASTVPGAFGATAAPSAGSGASSKSGRAVRIPVDQRVGKGDRVFRVRNALMAFADDALEPRVGIRGSVRLRIGEPLRMSFAAGAESVCVEGEPVEAARTRAVSEQDVRDHVDRLGQTPFSLESLDVELDEGVGIGFSTLHHLRAQGLEQLAERMLQSYSRRTLPKTVEDRRVSKAAAPRRSAKPLVVAWATNPSCARAARRAGADAVYVPLLNFRRGESVLAGARQDDPEQAGYPKQCIMALPTVDHDPIPGTREYELKFDLWDYVREGKPVFADSLASCVRACASGALVEVGPHVPLVNAAALQAMADMGVKRAWLSPELTLGQIDDIARQSPLDLGLTVVGAQELMITEHCLLMSQGPCNEQCAVCPRRSVAHTFKDRKGYDFPVVTDLLGRSHLYNGVELDAVPSIPDLIDIGVSSFMVDTTLMDKKEAEQAVSRVVRARDLALSEHRALPKRPNATTGHLFRGVS